MEINEIKLKKILKEQREEYQTHITALAEDFQSRLATDLEPLITLSRAMEDLAKSVSKLQTQVTTITEMVAQNTEDISEIKHNLKQKTGIEEFHTLEKRVLRLERKLA